MDGSHVSDGVVQMVFVNSEFLSRCLSLAYVAKFRLRMY